MLADIAVFGLCILLCAISFVAHARRARARENSPQAEPSPDIPHVWFAGLAWDEPSRNVRLQAKVFRFQADPGAIVVEGFRPGTDYVEIDLTDADGELFFDLVDSSQTPSVAFSIGSAGVLALRFAGLSSVPVGDMTVRMRGVGTDMLCVALADLMRVPRYVRKTYAQATGWQAYAT